MITQIQNENPRPTDTQRYLDWTEEELRFTPREVIVLACRRWKHRKYPRCHWSAKIERSYPR